MVLHSSSLPVYCFTTAYRGRDMEEKTQTVSIRFPMKLYNHIKEQAERERRSFNNQVLYYLERHLERKKRDEKEER
jgi:hypothetical protein